MVPEGSANRVLLVSSQNEAVRNLKEGLLDSLRRTNDDSKFEVVHVVAKSH